jgi:hypothetical protein
VSRTALSTVMSSGFEQSCHLALPVVEQLLSVAMCRGLLDSEVRFRRGDDDQPRRPHRPLRREPAAGIAPPWLAPSSPFVPLGIDPALVTSPALDRAPGFEENDDEPPAPAPTDDAPIDVLRLDRPSLSLHALDAFDPMPLPDGPRWRDPAVPAGATRLDALVAVTLKLELTSTRFADAPAIGDVTWARIDARVVVRPYLVDGVLGCERVRVDLTLSSAGSADLDAVRARALPEVDACMLAVIAAWRYRFAVTAPTIVLELVPRPTVIVATGAGDRERLTSVLDASDRVALVYPPAHASVATAAARDLYDGVPVFERSLPYHAWAAAITSPWPVEPIITAAGSAAIAQADGALRGRWRPGVVTAVHRSRGAIRHIAIDDAYYLTTPRAIELIDRGEMALPAGLQVVRARSGAYLRDVPDRQPGLGDDLRERPTFDPATTSLLSASHYVDFPVPPGRYRYHPDVDLLMRTAIGRPDQLELFPGPPTAVAILIHGVWNSVDDDPAGFKDALRRHHHPERMQRVWFPRLYWGDEGLLQGADGPGERVEQVEGLSERAWAGVAKLKHFVSWVRERLGPDVPITVVAHSLGSVLTLAALQEGLTIDNWILMGSPLSAGNVRTADDNTHFATAASRVRGLVLNCWSPNDGVAVLKGGVGHQGLPRAGDLSDLPLDFQHEGDEALDIRDYPIGGRANVRDMRVLKSDLLDFDHEEWWGHHWLVSPAYYFAGGDPALVAAMILGDNLPARGWPRRTLAEDRALEAWRYGAGTWANSTSTNGWWTEGDALSIDAELVLLPGLTTTFHADDMDKGWARLDGVRGRLRFRLFEAIGWDTSWTSNWHEVGPGETFRIDRTVDSSVYDATLLVEVHNLGDEIARGVLHLRARDV